jgi:large subunit ribosomal protein L29
MKRMKELKEMDKNSLEKRLTELRKELMKFRAQISTGTPPENPGQVRNIRKSIARIHTLKNLKIEGGEKERNE